MPILGPNCYGLINALDGVALWPDQHGCLRVERGVAIITQSSNIAINLTMQTRGLPIAYVVTAGNQAQTSLAELGMALLADSRVTALGLHIEGIGDPAGFEALARFARENAKPLVALKVGVSDQARAATLSHTASLSGSHAGARALFDRLGVGQANSLTELLETLKLLHVVGPLPSNAIASMSCSGGEASLIADAGLTHGVAFPPLTAKQARDLREALGPKVALANPLDYHTYIWADAKAMTRCCTAMMGPHLALGCLILDFPRADRCGVADWGQALAAVKAAAKATGRPMALVATLPECLPETIAVDAVADGVVPLSGLDDALAAVAIAAKIGAAPTSPRTLVRAPALTNLRALTEAEAKVELAAHGVVVPAARRAAGAAEAAKAAEEIGFPVALKVEDVAHKTEAGAVALGLATAAAVAEAAAKLPGDRFLVEEMITGALLELLIGVLADPSHGFVLTIGAGGVTAELLRDTQSLLLPVAAEDIAGALDRLRIAPLLAGYRGAPAVNRRAVIDTILAFQDYVFANAGCLAEAEINPLICTAKKAVAVDALIRKGTTDE
jgi:acyl-CoA synthetase (NDP forming)